MRYVYRLISILAYFMCWATAPLGVVGIDGPMFYFWEVWAYYAAWSLPNKPWPGQDSPIQVWRYWLLDRPHRMLITLLSLEAFIIIAILAVS